MRLDDNPFCFFILGESAFGVQDNFIQCLYECTYKGELTRDMKANGIGVARCVDQPHIYFEGSFKNNKCHGLSKWLIRVINNSDKFHSYKDRHQGRTKRDQRVQERCRVRESHKLLQKVSEISSEANIALVEP